MSEPVSTTGLGTLDKLIGLTKHTTHGQVPSPVSPHYWFLRIPIAICSIAPVKVEAKKPTHGIFRGLRVVSFDKYKQKQ
ncbi:hypothetical protein [Acetobacter oeni]|uniref:Uncharacterized protein n=1 Tax=Acetobacter oeni TaxID=304077 RepID=A0A511XL99_9PROT|nr:hypothetical protein [Acetobacter oeni]MBB3883501.1 hypothetical protein [Acetobacter oeni]NHO19542.1 hypothetical protein [Acetobacter oeni]GEN63722.1 hypothetical protein AOE01nite_19460 [Acetobacter oeni]